MSGRGMSSVRDQVLARGIISHVDRHAFLENEFARVFTPELSFCTSVERKRSTETSRVADSRFRDYRGSRGKAFSVLAWELGFAS